MGTKVSVIVPVYNVENYIEDMLLSVQNQTFKDFEVIVVNDGSTDESQKIIDKFCREDGRFKGIKQENSGVVGARTTGINLAQGEYVVFYDPDDFIPKHALEKMYKVASKRKADMVVGVMEEINLGERTIYMHSQKLAKQKYIDSLDQYFFGAWSLCNKMFSLKFIRDNNLEMIPLKHSEDGVFTFCVLHKAMIICGCDAIVYNYIKRPFWFNPSATQMISKDYLNELIRAHSRILEEISLLADKLQVKDKDSYMEKIYIRIMGDLISGYYRNNWRAQESLTDEVEKKLAEYREHITEESWQKILRDNKDISLENGIKTIEKIIENPLVSIVISDKLTAAGLNLAVGSLYNQMMPDFEILISDKSKKHIKEEYKKKGNIKSREIDRPKGKYVILIEEPIIFTKKSIKAMVDKLEGNKELDFVTMLTKNFNGKRYKYIKSMIAAYGYTNRGRKKATKLTFLDTMISNKMMRREVFAKFEESKNLSQTAGRLYDEFKFEKLKKGLLLTNLKEEVIISSNTKSPSKISIAFNYRKNLMIRNLIEGLKRHITREDIDKIKGKFGRR